jgi:hypothetical protein
VPDPDEPKMYRGRRPDGSLSDMLNLTRARDAARCLADSKSDHVFPTVKTPEPPADAIRGEIVRDSYLVEGHKTKSAPAMCKALLVAGHAPDRALCLYRGDTLCLIEKLVLECRGSEQEAAEPVN